jgi:hypothetical protein
MATKYLKIFKLTLWPSIPILPDECSSVAAIAPVMKNLSWKKEILSLENEILYKEANFERKTSERIRKAESKIKNPRFRIKTIRGATV